MNNFRLTVHVIDQPRVDTRAPRVAPQQKGEQKSAVDRAREQHAKDKPNTKHDENKVSNKGRYKVFNTLSSYHKSKDDCMKELANLKDRYNIQIGNDRDKPNKMGKELWSISFVN
jgi:hypothetical protein